MMKSQYNNHISISNLIYSNYIKYDKLTEIINYQYANSDAEVINIYIDIDSILRSISHLQMLPAGTGDYDLVAGIINMCAHYRYFFMNRYKVHTRIFLLHHIPVSDSQSFNTKFVSSYDNSIAMFPDIQKFVDLNLNLLAELVLYINDIQYINTIHEIGARIIDIRLIESSFKYPNIVITKDIYNMQLVSENTIVLRPKKYQGSDISLLINEANLIDTYITLRKNDPILNGINASMFSIILALTTIPERKIRSYVSLKKAISTINLCIANGLIPNWIIYDIDSFCKSFNSICTGKKIESAELGNRFKVTDLNNQHSIYTSMREPNDYGGIVNLYDPNAVKEINNKYFQKNPLDLNVL